MKKVKMNLKLMKVDLLYYLSFNLILITLTFIKIYCLRSLTLVSRDKCSKVVYFMWYFRHFSNLFCKLAKEKLTFVSIFPFMLYMPYSPQFVQEIDKQGSRIHPSQANLAWIDFSSLKRDLGREHRWISLPVRFQLAYGERLSRLIEIISLKQDLDREQHWNLAFIPLSLRLWEYNISLEATSARLSEIQTECIRKASLPGRSKVHLATG